MKIRFAVSLFALISFLSPSLFAQSASLMVLSPEARVARIINFLKTEAGLTKNQEARVLPVLMAREEERQALYQAYKLLPETEVPIDDVGNPFVNSLEKFHFPFDQQLHEVLTPDQFSQLLKMRQISANKQLAHLREAKGIGFFHDLEAQY